MGAPTPSFQTETFKGIADPWAFGLGTGRKIEVGILFTFFIDKIRFFSNIIPTVKYSIFRVPTQTDCAK